MYKPMYKVHIEYFKPPQDCYTNLCKRHRDPDEKVRLEAVKVVYAIASDDITRMTPELFMILQVNTLMVFGLECISIY